MKFLNVFLLTVFLSALSFTLYSAEQQLIVIRHGEADNNVKKIYNSNPANPGYKPSNLTAAGRKKTEETAEELISKGFNNNNIAAVYISPLPRTKQTADILVQQGLVSKDKIIYDRRLIELNAGDMEGKPVFSEWQPSFTQEFHAESEEHVKKRVLNFYQHILHKYPQGNIIVVTHALPARDLIEYASHQIVNLNPGEATIIPLRHEALTN